MSADAATTGDPMKNRIALWPMLLAVAVSSACTAADTTTSPNVMAASAPASASKAPHAAVQVLLDEAVPQDWLVRVLAPLSASVRVDEETGGVISIPATGATLTIPAGAVHESTVITMTALPGSLVAFDYSPAGTKFKKPLNMQVDLGLTNWNGQPFSVVYFKSNDDIDEKRHKIKISEVLPVTVVGRTANYDLWHFSGYALSSSRR